MVRVSGRREQRGAAGGRLIAWILHLAQTRILDRKEFKWLLRWRETSWRSGGGFSFTAGPARDRAARAPACCRPASPTQLPDRAHRGSPRHCDAPCPRIVRSRSARAGVTEADVVVVVNDGVAAWDDGARFADRTVVIRRGVLPKLRPPAQGMNRSSATSCSSAFISGGTPSADDFHGWATPVATDPRKTRDERPRGRTGSFRVHIFAAALRAAQTQWRSGTRACADGRRAAQPWRRRHREVSWVRRFAFARRCRLPSAARRLPSAACRPPMPDRRCRRWSLAAAVAPLTNKERTGMEHSRPN
jgi:hypothetical protein